METSERVEDSEWLPLSQLLPPIPGRAGSLSSSSSPYWTEDEIERARRANILAAIKRGWKYSNGFLEKGAVVRRPSQGMSSKSGDPDFNPRTEAFAVRRGGRFVSDNRYDLGGGMFCDRNGILLDPTECPECGGAPYHVLTRQGLPPNAKPWEFNRTYCRRCVTPEDLEDNRRRALAAPPKGRR